MTITRGQKAIAFAVVITATVTAAVLGGFAGLLAFEVFK